MNRERKFTRNHEQYFPSKKYPKKIAKYKSYKSYLNDRYVNSKHKRITKRQWKKYGGFRRFCGCCLVPLAKVKSIYKLAYTYEAFCSLECFIQNT